MRRLCLVLAVFLCMSLGVHNASAIDLSTMSLQELKTLQHAIQQEIEKNHEASSDERDKVLAAVKRDVEAYFSKINIDISWAWFNFEYTKDWNFFTLKTHIDFRDAAGEKQKPDVYAEVYNTSGNFQVYYIKVGTETLLDNRAALPSSFSTLLDAGEAPAAPAALPKVDTIKVTAKQLMDDYDNNELKADEKYKGKLLTVTGKVSEVRKSWGNTIVDIGTGAVFEWDINCYMSKDQTDRAAQLDKGDTVTITGTCDGLSFLSVTMKDCYFEP